MGSRGESESLHICNISLTLKFEPIGNISNRGNSKLVAPHCNYSLENLELWRLINIFKIPSNISLVEKCTLIIKVGSLLASSLFWGGFGGLIPFWLRQILFFRLFYCFIDYALLNIGPYVVLFNWRFGLRFSSLFSFSQFFCMNLTNSPCCDFRFDLSDWNSRATIALTVIIIN